MSDSSISFTDTGPVLPDSATVLQEQEAIWQAAFDNLLNPDPATPQGQLMASLAAIVQDKNAQLAQLAANFDPATASGVWQDALAAIYFLERQPALSTVVQVTCTGLSGTRIVGADSGDTAAQVKDADGNIFSCQTGGVIPESGSIVLPFAAVEPGPLVVPAHTITGIVEAQPGWDSVDNANAGTTGRSVEGRREFELRRRQSVALNSRSMLASVYGRVGSVDGVIDLLTRQNRTSAPITINGVTLSPHSVYVAVLGGADADIAAALYNSVSGGCDYNGTTTVQYTDPVTGAEETVAFQRPSLVSLDVRVSIRRATDTSSAQLERAKENILADVSGQSYPNSDGSAHSSAAERIHIGDTIYASRFVCPVLAAGIRDVLSVTLARLGQSPGTTVSLLDDEAPSLSADDIHFDIQDA